MHARIPIELQYPFAREIKRHRLSSAIRLYVPTVIIFTVFGLIAILWKGHAIVELVRFLAPDSVSDDTLIWGVALVTLCISAIGTFALFRHFIKKDLFSDYPYCRSCDAMDYDETGVCPCCGKPIKNKESFFFVEFDDERKILAAFGLNETKKN